MIVEKVASTVRRGLRSRGLDISRYGTDFSDVDKRILAAVEPFTMTSHARVVTMVDAVRHVHRNGIDGAFVECGVWRGGSAMAMAMAMSELAMAPRDFYLYDTFEGMTAPSARDVLGSDPNTTAQSILAARKKGAKGNMWCDASIQDVRTNMALTGYPDQFTHYVVGPVEQTIPSTVPDKIAILRLDTDWYASTRHELEHLYPLLERGGLLVVDDYGFWRGAREAVDEYFSTHEIFPFLARIDETGRVCMKPT